MSDEPGFIIDQPQEITFAPKDDFSFSDLITLLLAMNLTASLSTWEKFSPEFKRHWQNNLGERGE